MQDLANLNQFTSKDWKELFTASPKLKATIKCYSQKVEAVMTPGHFVKELNQGKVSQKLKVEEECIWFAEIGKFTVVSLQVELHELWLRAWKIHFAAIVVDEQGAGISWFFLAGVDHLAIFDQYNFSVGKIVDSPLTEFHERVKRLL